MDKPLDQLHLHACYNIWFCRSLLCAEILKADELQWHEWSMRYDKRIKLRQDMICQPPSYL